MKSPRSANARSASTAEALDSEQLLKATLDSSFNFIQVFRAIRDGSGQIIDFTWVLTNRRWQEAYGDVIGKSLLQQNPAVVHTGIFQRMIDVTETGTSQTHEHYYPYEQFDGWFQQTLTKLQDGVVLTTEEITERKRAEIRQTFLLKLSDALRPLADPVAIQRTAARLLVEHTGASRALYVEIEGEGDRAEAVSRGQYAHDVPEFPDRVPYADFAKGFPEEVLQNRETLVVADAATDARLTEGVRAAWLGMNVAAAIGVSLIKQGRMVANFGLHHAAPRQWTPEEIQLVEDVADRTWADVERAKAENRLRDWEARYRTVFESVDEGFHISELLYDEAGQPVDWRFLEVNAAFEQQTGLRNAAGQLGSALAPNTEPHWLAVYDQVLKTGEPYRFENYHAFTDRWYSAHASRIGGAGSHRFAVVFADTTERKRRERQQEFLLKLSDALRAEADAEAVGKRVLGMLAEHLHLDRCWISEVFEQQGISRVGPEYVRPELPPMSGVFRLSDYSETMRQLTTEPMFIEDVANDPRFSASEKELLTGFHLQALLVVPLRKGQRQVIWALATAMATPRHWTGSERHLLEEVAERTWAAVERARAEAALRESEEKFRTLFDSIDEGYALFELIYDAAGKPVDLFYVETNSTFKRINGFSETGKKLSEVLGQLEPFWYETFDHVLKTGEPIRVEHHTELTGVWYSVFCSRVGGKDSSRLAVVFDDITERKRAEANGKLLVDISEELSQLSDEAQLVHAIGAKLAAHLTLSCYHYVDVDNEQATVTIRHFWHAGNVPPILGTYPIDGFLPPSGLKNRRAGETDVVNDVQNELPDDTVATTALKAGAASQQIGAYVVVPYSRDGVWIAYFAVADSSPRRWTNADVALIEEVAGRLFPRIERVRAEAALRESEEKFRTLFNSIDEGVSTLEAIFDEEGQAVDYRYLENNSAVKTIFGFEWPVGKTVREFLPDVEAHWIETICGVARTGQPVRTEYPVESLGRWVSAHFSHVGGEGSRKVVAVYEDITERKEREQQQAFLLQFSDALRAEHSVDDAAIRALELLAEALRLDRCYIATYHLADDRADFLYQVGNHRVPPLPDAGIRLSDFPQALRVTFEGTLVVEDSAEMESLSDTDQRNMGALGLRALVAATLRKGEQNPHWAIVAVSATPRRWTPNEIALIEEVTERTWAAMERARAEEALQESEKRLRLALEATELGLWDWHLLTNEVYWNDQHFRLFGLEPQPLPITPDLFLNHVHPSDRVRVTALLQQAIADKRVYDAEFCAILENGSQRWMRGYGRIVEEEDGQPVRVSGVMFDIDERKRSEDALRLADRRKDEFLAMLAHELRNPMSTIRSGLQILNLTAGKDQPEGLPTGDDILVMMNRQTDHLVRMVDDLLDVSRISRGKIELTKERVDLVAIVRQAVGSVQPLFAQQNKTLHVELPDAPIELMGDTTRLTQVVTNLLTNGLRYTNERGEVWLQLTQPPGSRQAILRVRDNGIGLAADQLSAIFELFMQVDNSLARSKGGLGLGLTLVKQLVELHGGQVTAQSEGLGRGSTFTVHVPTLTAAATPSSANDPRATTPSGSRRILVIDDNADAAMTLGMLLKLNGYEAHTRQGGRAGIEAAGQLRPMAILLDIGMPELDGYETCRLIRQQPWGRDMVVIALTGYGQAEDRQRTKEAGFDGHLVKPVDLAALSKLLTDLLNQSPSGRSNASTG